MFALFARSILFSIANALSITSDDLLCDNVIKAKVQIDDMIFWLFFSVALIVLAAVPQIAHWAANLIGVISPVNLIYLVIIFVLLLKIFSMSIKFSQLESKLKSLTQELAVKETLREEQAAQSRPEQNREKQ